MTNNQFAVTWSDEDQEYVGTSQAYPSLSWLDPRENKALEGIKKLVADIENEEVDRG